MKKQTLGYVEHVEISILIEVIIAEKKGRRSNLQILSLDISASPGVAVLEIKDGKAKLIAVDHVVTDSSATDAQRYEYVRSLATRMIYENKPFDKIVREKFIRGGSKRSTQLVFGAWSTIDMALGAFGYAIDDKDEIVASSVKKLIGGKGGATKEEVAA